MNKKNLGLIALFILLIAAVVLLTAGETREEDAPLPDIRLTEIVPHSTQINADGYAMGSITLTSFADAPADLAGWGLADRVYKVKYVFERGTTLAPGGQARGEGHAALCFLRAVREARGARLSLCRRRKDERRNRAARARHGRHVSPRRRGVGGGHARCAGASGGRNLSLYNGESRAIMQKKDSK